jgi:hypothetical protein
MSHSISSLLPWHEDDMENIKEQSHYQCGECERQHKTFYKHHGGKHSNKQYYKALESILKQGCTMLRAISSFFKCAPSGNDSCKTSDQFCNVRQQKSYSTNDGSTYKQNLNFGHDLSFLTVKRVMSGTCGRDSYLPATHLNFADFITDNSWFGVRKAIENAEKCGKSIYYTVCVVSLLYLLCAGSVLADLPARVLYVIDGDTFRALVLNQQGRSFETSVRIAHIDTPEKKRGAECEAERQAGKLASDYGKENMQEG